MLGAKGQDLQQRRREGVDGGARDECDRDQVFFPGDEGLGVSGVGVEGWGMGLGAMRVGWG